MEKNLKKLAIAPRSIAASGSSTFWAVLLNELLGAIARLFEVRWVVQQK
ncbi:MAG: hypothetical protein AB4426_01835 [Xenococcaceae cyanobacterium]